MIKEGIISEKETNKKNRIANRKTNWSQIEKIVKPLYKEKDLMHGFPHIIRIKKKSYFLKKQYKKLDKDLLNFLIYFHGLKKWVKNNKRKVLNLGFKKRHIKSLIRSSDAPTKIEEKIVCDANTLENVGNFGIKRSLILAKEFNQSLNKTLEIAKKFQSKYKFYTHLGRKIGKRGIKIKQNWIDSMEKKSNA